jgi:hypothetical protein
LGDRGHFDYGEIYDPHWEGRDDDGVPEYRYCEEGSRCGLVNRYEKPEELYVLFRTHYRYLDGSTDFLIPGYYKVRKELVESEPRRSDPRIRVPVVKAEEAKSLSLGDAISIARSMDIGHFLRENNLYRVSFSSENPRFREQLEIWLDVVISEERENLLRDYQRETVRLKRALEEAKKNDEIYLDCSGCQYQPARSWECPLIRRREMWGKVTSRISREEHRRRHCS